MQLLNWSTKDVKWIIIMVLLLALLLSGCQPIVLNIEPAQTEPIEATVGSTEVLAQSLPTGSEEGPVTITGTEGMGFFNGVSYIRYLGTLSGAASGGDYVAPFEVMVPWDPNLSNERLLVEPLHWIGGAIVREYLTRDFLFGRGFGHAGICLGAAAPFVPNHPCQDFSGEPGMAVEIVADFARALKEDPALSALVGEIDALYGIGVAATVNPLHTLVRSEAGQGLFDLSLFVATGWPLPFAPPPEEVQPFTPVEGAGRIIVLNTEADILQFNGNGLRHDDLTHPSYRLYQVAGGPHIADTPSTRARFVGPPQSPFPPIEGTTPLDWSPVLRALFIAGDRWVTKGVEPAPSTYIEAAPEGEIDPVYERPTGIARDENLNARGGVRLPDLALGRGQFIAADTELMEAPYLFGGYLDLACEPLADGSARFSDHETYVAQFTELVEELVAQGFLLSEDAQAMIEAAAASDVGRPGTCS